MLGSVQGAEVVTARARDYAKGKLEALSYACGLVSFPSFSKVQELHI